MPGEDGIAVQGAAAGARTGEVPGKASKAALEDGVHWMVMDAGWMAEQVFSRGSDMCSPIVRLGHQAFGSEVCQAKPRARPSRKNELFVFSLIRAVQTFCLSGRNLLATSCCESLISETPPSAPGRESGSEMGAQTNSDALPYTTTIALGSCRHVLHSLSSTYSSLGAHPDLHSTC